MKSVDFPAVWSWTQAPTLREWQEYRRSSSGSVMLYTDLARLRKHDVIAVAAKRRRWRFWRYTARGNDPEQPRSCHLRRMLSRARTGQRSRSAGLAWYVMTWPWSPFFWDRHRTSTEQA